VVRKLTKHFCIYQLGQFTTNFGTLVLSYNKVLKQEANLAAV